MPDAIAPELDVTPRQREALDLLILGGTNSEIGRAMRPPIAENTVKRMLTKASAQFGYHDCNRVELAVHWSRLTDKSKGLA